MTWLLAQPDCQSKSVDFGPKAGVELDPLLRCILLCSASSSILFILLQSESTGIYQPKDLSVFSEFLAFCILVAVAGPPATEERKENR
ncbi:hypothetical protein C8J56DRAFT_1062406 [Mycena floridula]|nr:hypothetical protein C8J56DRAFT_1062406 [Mycena floridula]